MSDKPLRVKITGTSWEDVKVVDAESGRPIQTTKAVITFGPNQLPTVQIELFDVELDLVGFSLDGPRTGRRGEG